MIMRVQCTALMKLMSGEVQLQKTDQELLEIIRLGEGERVEFCEAPKKYDKFRKTICAFANDLPDSKEPGLLFIGVRDNGQIAGVEATDAKQLMETLGGLRNDGKILPFPVMSIETIRFENRDVVVVEVLPHSITPVQFGRDCWVRAGARCERATAEEERVLTQKRQWVDRPFDARPVTGATVKRDIDMNRFRTEYLPAAVSHETLAENNRSDEHQMQALRLVDDSNVNIPNATAILLLGKQPTDWLPGASIQFVRYAGTSIADIPTDSRDVRGTVVDQLDEMKKIVTTNNQVGLEVNAPRHVKKINYPPDALREFLANAVIHRNYHGAHAPTRINWYDDRIEIINPGGLYGGVTLESLNSGSRTDYRNPNLAFAMRGLGFMEQFGRGIPVATKALEENGNPPPEFNVEHGFFAVTVYKAEAPQ